MNTKYEKVPYIITGKDLDYLSDMFNWNYGEYKMSVNSNQNIIDVPASLNKGQIVLLEGVWKRKMGNTSIYEN